MKLDFLQRSRLFCNSPDLLLASRPQQRTPPGNNPAAERVSDRQQNTQFLFLCGCHNTYILAQKYVLRVSAVEIVKMINRLRVRLADKTEG